MARVLPWLTLLALSILYRLPALINAGGTNSDAAIVGLQAMHILRGEWSWFLYGSGYQTSVDSLVAAVVFAFTGPSPLALMASTLAGHILLTWFAYAILRRRLPAWTAAIATLPLVFTAGPLHTYILFPPRQASLTLVFAALWLLDGARTSSLDAPPRPERAVMIRLAAGGAVASLACFADPYALLFLPIHALLALLVAFDGKPGRTPTLRRAAGAFAGALVGMVPYWLLTHSPLASHGPRTLKADLLSHNWALFWDDCLPWLLSYKVYAAKHMSDYAPWEVSGGVHAIQIIAALLFVVGLASGAVLFFVRRVPWEIRRLGLIGAAGVPVTVGGFLVSVMVMDHFSSRYLVAIVLLSPFALAPAAFLLSRARFSAALAPFLLSSALGGWASFLPWTLSVEPSVAVDQQLGAALRARGVRYAVADYWASYRLTLLYREDPIVVPKNEVEDRYRPYRDAFDQAPRVAYIYDPFRSRESLAEMEQRIRSDATPFQPDYERLEIGRFTALILSRKATDTRSAWKLD